MKKTKKNKAGKKTTLLGGATKRLRKLGQGTATGIGGLSTTQKVVGGAALVALGLSYLTKRRDKKAASADGAAAEHSLSAMDENADHSA
ncbi:hypothetical protein [Hymenobacter sp.]|uniref:hypothetical protein n=1 Tax=Hymenobacter sp. TaxID=1898978 RepID=UPI00286AF963|nr:hypothetical protein [Hymenobacter sp.]